MFRARCGLIQFSKTGQLVRRRAFCNTNNKLTTNPDRNANASVPDNDVYRKLENLDFAATAEILFTALPKKKKFGIDFHLVQLFFVCMPSLAVYLVAQYARYEMRRMEEAMKFSLSNIGVELELKKKQTAEEEEKANELDSNAAEEKEEGPDAELLEVKVRLDKLEEAVNEIVVESKKQLDSRSVAKNQDTERKPNNNSSRSHSG